MFLTSEETQTEFEFHAVGYQFDDVLDEEYDANWLMIRIRVKTPEGDWTKTDPCLLTWEGHWLANWLADAELGGGEEKALSFLEANIQFEVAARDDGRVHLRVKLSDELLVEDTGGEPPGRCEILLVISKEEIRKALSEWCWQMRLFPARASRARPCRPYWDKRTGCVVCGTE